MLAVVMVFSAALCGFDHGGPVAGTAKHGEGNPTGCIVDHCVTLISKNFSSPANAAGLFWLFAVALGFGLSHRLGVVPRGYSRLLKTKHPPHASNKLYQLHAAYLI